MIIEEIIYLNQSLFSKRMGFFVFLMFNASRFTTYALRN